MLVSQVYLAISISNDGYISAANPKEFHDTCRGPRPSRIVFTNTSHGVLRTAELMHRIGRIKVRPGSWEDLSFENVHGRNGS